MANDLPPLSCLPDQRKRSHSMSRAFSWASFRKTSLILVSMDRLLSVSVLPSRSRKKSVCSVGVAVGVVVSASSFSAA